MSAWSKAESLQRAYPMNSKEIRLLRDTDDVDESCYAYATIYLAC